MVPLRFGGSALGVPVSYEKRTHSVLVGPTSSGHLWLLPLESLRPGIVVHSPKPGSEVQSPVRVHGQANVFEGTVVVELRDSAGKTLGRGIGTGAMGSYGPFIVELPYDSPDAARARGKLFLYSPSPRDEREILFPVSVPVTLR
jgi:hypothetical protein